MINPPIGGGDNDPPKTKEDAIDRMVNHFGNKLPF